MSVISVNPIESVCIPQDVMNRFEIKIPASIANLGPGFDTLAVAVQLYLTLRVRKMHGSGSVEFHFLDHELRGENYIERAYRALAGESFARLPSLSVEVRTEIPMCAGLGSSAAATVAGLRLYESVAGPLPLPMLLNVACALESHPDNAAASLLGGLALSCQLPDGTVHATRFPWPDSMGFVVLTPHTPLTTGESRAVLPESISRADAVFNLQRVALLLQSLHSGDFSQLRHALGDRLHQPARQKIVPLLARALELEHRDLCGVCLSGSGPSIVAIAQRSQREIGELLGSLCHGAGVGYSVRTLQVHHEGSEYVPICRSGLLCC